jgi:Uma2 family endonuclease
MYEKMLDIVGQRPIRVTFDGESLEVMTLSPRHEVVRKLFGRLFDVIAEELSVQMLALGSTTFRRRAKERGLEPDQCYYMISVARIRDWQTLDRVGPVPDLAVEVDQTHSSLNRMEVYAGLGVPEVWRFAGEMIEVSQLRGRQYRRVRRSLALPFVPLEEIPDLFRRCMLVLDEGLRLRMMRKWVRTRVAPLKEAAGKRRGRSPGR